MKKVSFLIQSAILVSASAAFAEEMAHGPVTIPWRALVFPQIFNFVLFVGVLVYFLRKPLREHFLTKAKSYSEAKNKAEMAKAAAERHHYDAEVKLRTLADTSKSSIEDAKREAEALKAKMIIDARANAERQLADVAAMAQFEYQRAISGLRLEVVNSATDFANALLQKRADGSLKSKLNEESIKKVKMR